MTGLLNAALIAAILLVLVPVGVLLAQVLVAALPGRPGRAIVGERPRLAILVPAHDEASGLRATLDALVPQLAAGDRILVVADNCADDTAQIARAAGAEAVERRNPDLRGKGYALDFGLAHLDVDPPQVVVIVDADCLVAPGTIDRIARACAASGRPVQALYLMDAPRPAGVSMAIAEFAWRVRNLVRPLGFHRLGLPCQLTGSGMAVEWSAIRSISLASGHIVEDMQMGVDLARAGKPPLFCPDTLVSSEFPLNAEGARTQRTRWEHGHLSMICGTVPAMLLDSLRGRGRGLAAMALDISVPPLALLALTVAALVAASAALALLTASTAPFWLAIAMAAMFALAVLVAWRRFAADVLPLRNFLMAFGYVAGKLPLYFRFLVRRQVEWVRSKRDGE
jgi:cellulose synthase/poly-beta-1,6-N-acetylglucosamine synthase-like glycosyltransferase